MQSMNLSKTVLFRGKLYHLQLQAGIHGIYWQIHDDTGRIVEEGRHDRAFVSQVDSSVVPRTILDEQVHRLMRAV